MTGNRTGKKALRFLSALAILGGLAWAMAASYRRQRHEAEHETEGEAPVPGTSRVSVRDGESVVTLDAELQTRSGLTTTPLVEVSRPSEVRAFGVVLDVQELADLRGRHAAARGETERARAQMEAARKERDRLASLAGPDGGVSARAIEAAEATFLAEKGSADSADAARRAAADGVRLRWGEVIADWMAKDAPELDRLLGRQDVLIQVSLLPDTLPDAPPDAPADASAGPFPVEAMIQSGAGAPVAATWVSPAPRTDPRLQGPSGFYRAPSASGLLPGMNVLCRLPSGAPVQGVVVPASAVLWWQGRAWVYIGRDATRFVRREVDVGNPVPEGWFVRQGLLPGDRVVVTGAQQILSEEFRSQIQEDE